MEGVASLGRCTWLASAARSPSSEPCQAKAGAPLGHVGPQVGIQQIQGRHLPHADAHPVLGRTVEPHRVRISLACPVKRKPGASAGGQVRTLDSASHSGKLGQCVSCVSSWVFKKPSKLNAPGSEAPTRRSHQQCQGNVFCIALVVDLDPTPTSAAQQGPTPLACRSKHVRASCA